jgi:ketosteroid isomerase-like protein
MLSRIWLCGCLIAVAACAPAGQRQAAVDTKAEEAKLMETSRQWSALAAAGKDPQAVAAYWADDAVLFQDNVPTIRGRDAARKFVEQAFAMPGFKIEWEPIEAHVSASGDMGYLIERSRVTEPDANGKPVTNEARALTVWRKDASGNWRNVVDMSNAEVKAQ